MRQGLLRSSRKRALILGAAVIATFGLAGVRRFAQVSQANSDRNSLRQQRTAMGMPDPDQMRARMLDNLARDLGLTETQKGQLKTAMEAGPDPRSVFRDRSLSREQRFERMRELGEARDARVRSILTSEQIARFNEGQEQMREEMRARFKKRGTGANPFVAPAGGQRT